MDPLADQPISYDELLAEVRAINATILDLAATRIMLRRAEQRIAQLDDKESDAGSTEG